MNPAKIRLSDLEESLIQDAQIILTKNNVIAKVRQLLEQLQERQLLYLSSFSGTMLPVLTACPPKITRGENYRGLPYLVLDHPRVFEKENILAIRTMFWWGHYFSVTLHLSGRYKHERAQTLSGQLEKTEWTNWLLAVSDDEWDHCLEEPGYRSPGQLRAGELDNLLASGKFFKIARRWPLLPWEELEAGLFNDFTELLKLLA